MLSILSTLHFIHFIVKIYFFDLTVLRLSRYLILNFKWCVSLYTVWSVIFNLNHKINPFQMKIGEVALQKLLLYNKPIWVKVVSLFLTQPTHESLRFLLCLFEEKHFTNHSHPYWMSNGQRLKWYFSKFQLWKFVEDIMITWNLVGNNVWRE